MERWNLKHISVYASVIMIIITASLFESAIPAEHLIVRSYLKLLTAVPALFIIAAFLAFRISETGIALAALSFCLVSLSGLLTAFAAAGDLIGRFFTVLPFMLPFSLSLTWLLPQRSAGMPFGAVKFTAALTPLLFFTVPVFFETILLRDYIYGGYNVPWPGITASFIPLIAPFLYRDRRSGTFSAALVFSLILLMLPVVLSLGGLLSESCRLAAGLIMLHSLYRVYWENSYIDELTGLYNRRALDERLNRLGGRYSLAMADVDHFKNFNDTYGHDEGDNVLRLVAKILYLHFGTSAYRYGGEEFCVVFRKTDAVSAAEEMNEAREDIAKHGFSIRRSQKNRKKSERKTSSKAVKKVQLTVSAGVAQPGGGRPDSRAVLKKADKALYAAKNNGRNRVETAR